MKKIYSIFITSILVGSIFIISAFKVTEETICTKISRNSPVSQNDNSLYPSYNTSPIAPDTTGMPSNAVQLAAKMKIGWNIGNTLEASGGETAWGNPKVTKSLIDLVKKNGFNAIRIPCAWNQYLSNTSKAEIDKVWLNRVKEVVDYCIANDMYVLLNIHWDGGWLETNCKATNIDEVNAKQKAFWEQIATFFRDYDEHLMFATTNEPNVENAEQMAVLLSYHQTGIDAIRSTGGRNAYRCIVIQGPSTDIEKTYKLMHVLPTDKVPNRLMVELHFYTPYNFCGLDKDADWGRMTYYWGKQFHSPTDTLRNAYWGEEDIAIKSFAMIKEQFTDKGIPVIIGEYGVMRRSYLSGDDLSRHLASRAYWIKYVTKLSVDIGAIPFYWDAGGSGVNSWGLFDRNTNKISDYQALNALLQGARR